MTRKFKMNRRQNHLFGWSFDLSLKWLIMIIVMGLVQFGVFWEQFRTLNKEVAELNRSFSAATVNTQILIIHDATQDAEIAELKRRMNEVKR